MKPIAVHAIFRLERGPSARSREALELLQTLVALTRSG